MITIILVFSLLLTPFLDEQKDPPKFKNIVILLDLSNRIKPNKNSNQAKKDQQIIEALLESFQERQQRQFLFLNSRDKFSIVVANQRNSNLNLNKYGEALSIDMTNPVNGRRMTKPVFDKEKKSFTDAVSSLYSEATEAKTTGADIWSFFRDNLTSNLKPSSEYQNYIIILTDGYMDLDKDLAEQRPSGTYMSYSEIQKLRNKNNWEEIFENQDMTLRPHKADYKNLKALVLEVEPKDPVVNSNELPILKKFWGTWFNEMNIPYQIHASNDNIGSTKSLITNFVFK